MRGKRFAAGGIGVLLAVAIAPASALAAERHVVPTGGQSSGDCAASTPCTFQWAFKDRPPQPGDEIILTPGTYTFNSFPIGTVPLRVRPQNPSERPVFQLNGTSALFNAGTDISDITFTGSPPANSQLLFTGRRSERVEVRSLGPGVSIGNPESVFVDSLVVAQGGTAIELQAGGGEDVRIRGVTAVAIGPGNYGVHAVGSGSGIFTSDSSAHLNSTIARGPGGDLAATIEGSASPSPTARITARRSNYRSQTGPLTFVDGGGNQTSAAQTSAATLFVDAGGGNYRLAPGSPAIDAGELTFDNGAFDLDGGPRTLGAAMDIGAFEAPYVAPQPPPPPPPVAAPETELTKSPKRKVVTRKRRVRLVYRFTSSLAESTFECAFGKSGFKPCSSPFRKRVKAKRKAKAYRFLVRAISDEGVVDRSPARARTKVKRRKR